MKHLAASPHGELQEIFDGIWFVKGSHKMPVPMPLPMRISRAMTVLRNAEDGTLTVVNSMRLSERGHAELDALGKVTRVLRIGGFHGCDDGYYRERYGAKIYAVKGMTYRRGMKPDQGPTYLEPDVVIDEDSPLPIPSARLKVFASSNPPEALLLLDRDGGIVVSADALQNTAGPDKHCNWLGKIVMRRMGFFKPYAVGAGWLEFAKPEAEDVRSVLDLQFEHVLPGHGDPVIGEAKSKYAEEINGPLKGCHAPKSRAA
jgi:hypothetical protein